MQCGFCRRAFDPSVLESRHPAHTFRADRASDAGGKRVGELDGTPASRLLVWEGEGG